MYYPAKLRLFTLFLLIIAAHTAPLIAQSTPLCAADASMLNGQGRFSLTGLGRFSLTGLEGADTTLDPGDGVPQELIDEVMNNPIDAKWLEQFFDPFLEIEASPEHLTILVIDDFADDTLTVAELEEQQGEVPPDWLEQINTYYGSPNVSEFPVLTHGDMVMTVLDDLYDVLDLPDVPSLNELAAKIHLQPVDISVGGSYELSLIVPQIEQAVSALREAGNSKFILNMSFGLLPCYDDSGPYPPFSFADFIQARNATPRWVLDVDAHITQNNEPTIRPVVYNGYGVLDYLMDAYGYSSEEEALAHLQYLFQIVAAEPDGLADLAALLQNYLDLSAVKEMTLIPIAASGNFADIMPNEPLSPAALDQSIAVGATLGMDTQIWPYSQPAHMVAPGAWYNMYLADSYVAGTSFSAPYASMVAAMYAAYPGSCEFPQGNAGALPPLYNFDYLNDVLSASNIPFNCQLPGVVQPGVTISQSGNTAVTEGNATGDSYSLVLDSQPTEIVKINLSAGNDLEISPQSVTFDSFNWYSPQFINVNAADDSVDEDTETTFITHTIDTADPDYMSVSVSSVMVTITDNDTAGLVLSKNTAAVTEGGNGDSFTVRLATQPTAVVTVTLTFGADITATTPLQFTPNTWNTPQPVDVSAVNDNESEGTETGILIGLSTASGDSKYTIPNAGSVSITVTDNDSHGLLLSKNTAAVTEGGAPDTVDVSLKSQPAANVTVTLTFEGDLSVTTPLTFTPGDWNQPQTVNISVPEDNTAEGIIAILIGLLTESGDPNYDIANAGQIEVTVTDNDTAGVLLSKNTAALTEGGAPDTVDVSLKSQPADNVTVTLSFEGDLIVTTPLTFTPEDWNEPQTVNISVPEDNTAEGIIAILIGLLTESGDPNYDIADAGSINVTVTDNDLQLYEILNNPGFEVDNVEPLNQPDQWTPKFLSKDRTRCDTPSTEITPYGNCAYVFTGTPLEKTQLFQSSTTNVDSLTPGTKLRTSIHYRTAGGAPKLTVRRQMFFVDASGPVVTFRTITTPRANWTKFNLPAYTIPEGKTLERVKIIFLNRALTGRIFIDNATVNYSAMLPRSLDALPLPPAN